VDRPGRAAAESAAGDLVPWTRRRYGTVLASADTAGLPASTARASAERGGKILGNNEETTMKIEIVGAATNITLEEGVPHAIVVQVRDSAGNAIDLTGRTIKWQVRRTLDSATTLLDKTTDNGGITNGGATGNFTINVAEADLVDVDWMSAVHDVKIVGLLRPFHGTLTIDKQVAI